MALPSTCPNCKRTLVGNTKPHCMEKRRTPCGWVVCSSCKTTIDRRGNHYPRNAVGES